MTTELNNHVNESNSNQQQHEMDAYIDEQAIQNTSVTTPENGVAFHPIIRVRANYTKRKWQQQRMRRLRHHIRRCRRWQQWDHRLQQRLQEFRTRLDKIRQQQDILVKFLDEDEEEEEDEVNEKLKLMDDYNLEKMNSKQQWEQEQVNQFEVIMQLEEDISKIALNSMK